jgi:hypothetical protein
MIDRKLCRTVGGRAAVDGGTARPALGAVSFFPSLSRFLGYGRIADTLSAIPLRRVVPHVAPVAVNFYTFFSCPFCPIVLARLQALQQQMGLCLSVTVEMSR